MSDKKTIAERARERKAQPRLSLEPPTKEAVRLIGDEPSPESLRRTRRTQMHDLAEYLRRGPTAKKWTTRAISAIKVGSKMANKLSALAPALQVFENVEQAKEAARKKRQEIGLDPTPRRM